ncbi:MAG: hypothetical protein COB35_08800 [Gammaproteobacteria bacterium]|nr:MAG: hypothetical protein COB35_08800 [Gammaproteobacteria bacterium]
MSIRLSIKKLSLWQRDAFCAALLERMLPNYQMFSQTANFGEYSLLRNQLDLFWQKLSDRKIKINTEAQLVKLEPQIPDPEKFDFFGVFPALDTCMALMSLLQGGQDSGVDHIEQVSKLSQNSVSYYLEQLLATEIEEQDNLLAAIAQHPLMQWEMATQQELSDFLLSAAENKQTCEQLKLLVLAEGLSNLGIEIN